MKIVERDFIFKDQKCHTNLNISSDGITTKMDIFVKILSDDTNIWLNYILSSTIREYIYILSDSRYNSTSKIFYHSVECPVTSFIPPDNIPNIDYYFMIGYGFDDGRVEDGIRVDGSLTVR